MIHLKYKFIFTTCILCFCVIKLINGGVLVKDPTGWCSELNPDWTCKDIDECPKEKDAKSWNPNDVCGISDNGPMVCCGSQPLEKNKVSKRATSNLSVPKSEKMCKKYAENVITWMESPVLLEDSTKIKVDNCGIIEQPLIVGGIEAKLKEFPHMAMIGFGNESAVYWLCGGSIISERYILTAAHCSKSKDKSTGTHSTSSRVNNSEGHTPRVNFEATASIGSGEDLKDERWTNRTLDYSSFVWNDLNWGVARWARLGELNIASEDDGARPVTLDIVERINHPEYNDRKFYNDIAVFKLESDVEFNNHVRPICLERSPNVKIPSEKLLASGWGRTRFQGWSSEILMKVNLAMVETDKCNKSYEVLMGPSLDRGIDPNSMICAGGDGKDTCQGDSGGPLQYVRKSPYCMYSQIGVTSFGTECGLGRAAVYTKVSAYIDWIESIVWP